MGPGDSSCQGRNRWSIDCNQWPRHLTCACWTVLSSAHVSSRSAPSTLCISNKPAVPALCPRCVRPESLSPASRPRRRRQYNWVKGLVGWLFSQLKEPGRKTVCGKNPWAQLNAAPRPTPSASRKSQLPLHCSPTVFSRYAASLSGLTPLTPFLSRVKRAHTDRCPLKKGALWSRALKKGVHSGESGRWLSKKVCTLTDDPQKKCAFWSMPPCQECTFCHEHSRALCTPVHRPSVTVPLMALSGEGKCHSSCWGVACELL